MSTKTINIFIDKYTQCITPNIIIATNLLSLVLFFLSTCLLVTIKNYIIIAVLLGLLIAQLVAMSLLNRKKDITIYNFVGQPAKVSWGISYTTYRPLFEITVGQNNNAANSVVNNYGGGNMRCSVPGRLFAQCCALWR